MAEDGHMEILMCLPRDVYNLIKILNSHGKEAFAVGGCVRDFVMGFPPADYDMTTSATPDETTRILEEAGIRTIPTGIKHGTVSAYLNGKIYEITTFRTDGEYKNSRHPESVSFTDNLSDDLVRRDFTINAMAADINGKIYDLFSGVDDINKKTIRAVGDPYKRFSEDALRILRAVRFSSRLGFRIEKETYNAAKELSKNLKNVSVERKISELSGILLSNGAQYGVKTLFDIGAMDYIIEGAKIPTMNIDAAPKTFECRMAALLFGSTEINLSSLKLSNKQKQDISLLLNPPAFENTDVCARKILRDYKDLAVDLCMLYGELECAKRVEEQKKLSPCVTISALAIGGNDVITLGFDKRNTSKILNFALDGVIENPTINEKDKLIQYILNNYAE